MSIRVRVSSSIKKAQERFDPDKPIMKCKKCGFWKNIEKSEIFLFKSLGYHSCMNCGSTDIEL